MAKVRIENSVHGFTSDDDLPKGTDETVREGDVVRGGFKNGIQGFLKALYPEKFPETSAVSVASRDSEGDPEGC